MGLSSLFIANRIELDCFDFSGRQPIQSQVIALVSSLNQASRVTLAAVRIGQLGMAEEKGKQ